MAWALKFVAGSGYAQNTTAMVKPTGDAYLEIDVKFDNIVSGMTTYLAWVGGSAGSQRVYLSVNFNDNIGFAGRGSMVSSNSYKAVTGERHTLRIAFESGEWVGYFDAVEVGRYTNSMSDIQNGGFNFAVNRALTIGNDDFSIISAKWVDVNTPANNRTYSADASDKSGTTDQPTLTETVSGLDAAGTNFPSFDSSVWVDLGGGGSINISGSLTIPAPTLIGNLTKTNPSFDSSGSVVISKPVSSGQLSSIPPQFNTSISVTIPKPQLSAIGNNTKPNFDSSASITIPPPVVAGNISNGVGVISLNGNVTVSKPLLGGSLSKSNPQFNTAGSLLIAKPVLTGVLSNSVPLVDLSGSVSISKPLASGGLSKSEPIFNASGSITISKPQITGNLVNGTINITFNAETNYNQPYLTSNFSQPNQSTVYVQPYKSTNRSQ